MLSHGRRAGPLYVALTLGFTNHGAGDNFTARFFTLGIWAFS
jgi:hypothetical protein